MAGLWIEVQIETSGEVAEILAATLADLTGGVEIRDAETVFPTAPDRAAVIALCAPEDLEDLLATVEETLATARAGGTAVDPVSVRQRPAHEDEWRDLWKQFFRTTRIGQHFIVRPSWDPAPVVAGTDHVIDLDPGRAFGTGAHPSTKLVIAALERLRDERPSIGRFLDLGCGSGILSIAASRLWPGSAGLAVDLDEEATACTRENFERNGVGNVEVATGSLGEVTPGPFDVIAANIQADVLRLLAPFFPTHLASGGRLVLSGLLVSDLEGVRAAYRAAGLEVVAESVDGEWGSLVLAARAELPAGAAPS